MLGLIATDMSGAMGGVVASRNRAGSYFRARITPVNPNTAAQATMRADFASASSGFHSLTDAQKANWNEFAANYYTPRGGRVPGMTYTGQNAYVGHRFNLLNMNRVNPASGVTTVAPVGYTFGPDPANPAIATVPANAFSSNIQLGDGTPLIVTATGASFDISSNTAQLTLSVNGAVSHTAPAAAPDFIDPVSGLRVGYLLLTSLGNEQEGTAPIQRKARILASTGILDAASGTGTMGSVVTFAMANVDVSGWRENFSAGEIITVDVYAVSEQGHTQPVGQVRTEVQA